MPAFHRRPRPFGGRGLLWLSKKWLAPLFRGVHSSLAPTARPGSYARKPLLRKAFCGFDAHVAKSDQSLRGLRPPNPRGFFDRQEAAPLWGARPPAPSLPLRLRLPVKKPLGPGGAAGAHSALAPEGRGFAPPLRGRFARPGANGPRPGKTPPPPRAPAVLWDRGIKKPHPEGWTGHLRWEISG